MTGMSSLIGYTRLQVRALERRAVLDERHRRFAVRTGENLEQFRVDGHVGLYDTFRAFVEQFKRMKFAALVAVLSVSIPLAATRAQRAQGRADSAAARRRRRQGRPRRTRSSCSAIASRRTTTRPARSPRTSARWSSIRTAADIPAELAGLYLRQNKVQEAMAAAEAGAEDRAGQPRSEPRARHRLRRAVGERRRDRAARGRGADAADANLAKAISHLEPALDGAVGESDPNVRATLARLYVRSGAFDKAIPLLTDLVNQEPGWQDGPLLLVEAYAGAGRSTRRDRLARGADAPTIRGCCRRSPTSTSASGAGPTRPARTRARCSARRATLELKTRYASALLNAGGRDNIDEGARRADRTRRARRATDARALYLLSQAQRRLGDFEAAEATARRVIAQNDREPVGLLRARRSARGAASVSGGRRRARAGRRRIPRQGGRPARSTSACCCRISASRTRNSGSTTRRSRRSKRRASSSPSDPAIAGYLIEANIAAKKYGAAVDAAQGGAGAASRTICGSTRLQAQALRHDGKADAGHRAARGGGQAARRRAASPTSRSRRSTRTPSAARRR